MALGGGQSQPCRLLGLTGFPAKGDCNDLRNKLHNAPQNAFLNLPYAKPVPSPTTEGADMRALATALVISVISLTLHAQQSSSLLGKWSGTMSTAGGGELVVELTLSETAGTWRFVPRGLTRNNCLGKDFPVAVTAQSATEIKFEVRGASVIPGCINSSAVLKAVDGNRLEGSLDDGRIVKLARQS